jgi:hypothetical protein
VASYGNFVPTDYLPADGRLLPINLNLPLFALLGTTYGGDGRTTFALPDLRGRTIIGASAVDPVGTLVGSPTVSLSNSQTPNGLGNLVQPFDNREPSLALNYLIALSGIFPSQDGGGGVDPTTPFVGEVMAFAGNFARPAGRSPMVNCCRSIRICPCSRYLVRPTAAMEEPRSRCRICVIKLSSVRAMASVSGRISARTL